MTHMIIFQASVPEHDTSKIEIYQTDNKSGVRQGYMNTTNRPMARVLATAVHKTGVERM